MSTMTLTKNRDTEYADNIHDTQESNIEHIENYRKHDNYNDEM